MKIGRIEYAPDYASERVVGAMSVQATLEPTINRLRFALLKYGGHILPCPGRPCECGFLCEWQFAELPANLGDVMDIDKLKPLSP